MEELRIPKLLRPELIEAINSNRDALKFIFEPEGGELVVEGGKCHIKHCHKIGSIKFVLSDVQVDVDNGEIEYLREQIRIKDKELEEIKEQFNKIQGNDDELEDLFKQFHDKNNIIREITVSLKEHQGRKDIMEARLEEKIELYRAISKSSRGRLTRLLREDIERLEKDIDSTAIIIEKIKDSLKEEMENRISIEESINEKTKGLFAKLFNNYDFTETGLSD